ncbi:uncharacterized protein EI90DRAFT_2977087 [Cantharellus anzutake]|uniref:uncharacterized protein n=1 Tax=Cantharellus anzutake TaxID=1750568 RepID=UPI0019086F99|nr:uncharacterized protein EI90DRAFT_2977087 [Cantharellus anzutake]KAF8324452.1 hypothetical protein EI90DRAFT_2977087 [Cantharellus anzutake]
MSGTPQTRSRVSGLPTPSHRSVSGLPTPTRARSSAGAYKDVPLESDAAAMRALSDAIRANDPAQHRSNLDASGFRMGKDALDRQSSVSRASSNNISAPRASTSSLASSVASSVNSHAFDRSTSTIRPKTPASATSSMFRSTQTPRSSTTTISTRPGSRTSDVFGRTPSRSSTRHAPSLSGLDRPAEVGDYVRIDSLDVEGTIRFLGGTEFKAGVWAGVELCASDIGKGKNNGTVAGVKYFSCPPNCGVFVLATKLTRIPVRPSSVASSHSRPPSSMSGRITPASRSSMLPFKTPDPPKISAGSRASKYVGLTARQLASSKENTNTPRVGSISPTRSPARSVTSFATPKPGKPSAIGLPGPGPRRSLATSTTITPRAAAVNRNGKTESPVPDLPDLSFIRASPSRMKPIGSNGFPSSRGTPAPEQPLDSPVFKSAASDTTSALQANAQALQERIAKLVSGVPVSPKTSPTTASSPAPPFTSASTDVAPADDEVRQFIAKIEQLESELARVRSIASEAPAPAHPVDASNREDAVASALEAEKAVHASHVADLEKQIRLIQDSAKTERETLRSQLLDANAAMERSKQELDRWVAQNADLDVTVAKLKSEVSSKNDSLDVVNSALSQSNDALKSLQEKFMKSTEEFEGEKAELTMQVDELRLAGQETIALYEERLSNSEARRYDLEDVIKSLEEQLKKQAEPISAAELQARANTAAQIDNETLQEQVKHFQKRISNLEEQLDEARAAQERDEQAIMTRVTRFREAEVQLKKEIALIKQENDEIARTEASARARVEEVTEALRESDLALEDARAEIETLRGDIASLEAAASAVGAAADGADDPISKLRVELQAARIATQEKASANEALKAQVASLQTESGELDKRYRESLSVSREYQERLAEMSRVLEQRTTDLEPMRGVHSPARENKYVNGRDDSREQITGLKHVVQQLTKENAALIASSKVLESDNKMLTTETGELRESLKELEEKFEQTILREQSVLDGAGVDPSSPLLQDVATLRQAIKDAQARHEREMEQMRRRVADMEKKHARTVHDLNKEIAELENLVEAKIYREDDLEREIERLKEKLSRRTAKASSESVLSKPRETVGASNPNGSTQKTLHENVNDDLTCEVCGERGHDLLTCHLVFDSPRKSAAPSSTPQPDESWCQDCESKGHNTETCPYSQDVF